MVLGGIIFIVGTLGLVLFVLLRLAEERRGRHYFAPIRTRLDGAAARVYRLAVLGELPSEWRLWLAARAKELAHRTVAFLVLLLRAIERPLIRINQRLRSSRPRGTPGREPSPFLKDMTGTKENGEPPEKGSEEDGGTAGAPEVQSHEQA